MDNEAQDKAQRVLSIYSKLRQGKMILKETESRKYGVSSRTIQRDIADIQAFLLEQENENGVQREVIFDKGKGGYRLETKVSENLSAREILAVGKVLLESRALMKRELFPIIRKMVSLCADDKERVTVKELLQNEMHHYIELQHRKDLLEYLWKIEQAVRQQYCLKIRYRKTKDNEVVERKVMPVGLMFSEFYFYMPAFIENIDRALEFQNPDDGFPTIYRVDRLESFEVTKEHFSIPYASRFEEGEFRKRVQFMFGGKLRKIRFKYKGNCLDMVLDRFPTAEVVRREKDGVIVRSEVFGDGVERWIRMQGKDVEMM